VFLEAKGDELLCVFTSSDHFFVFKAVLHGKQQNIVDDKPAVIVVFFSAWGGIQKYLITWPCCAAELQQLLSMV